MASGILLSSRCVDVHGIDRTLRSAAAGSTPGPILCFALRQLGGGLRIPRVLTLRSDVPTRHN